ncbi:cytochrome c biogenesis protein CcmE [Xaviernesmea oryzae]|uniref:Cytochrome c-type biogenesis protein CcmE n=1 Tax=Xaviernesmea oryzae TaxID=464029 RepID=A0A1Q9B1L3_9HYPH|nr:cytochrome c maturation protein CcmE [Xaviernesmea oryzae]OLP61866.1 cytochrome c biogenesis protein CcmE [Xaviernesmea oryzae]SEL74976.1 cytochrome c-type biogenesis protein CcmE [Xaviernesmea oryzae]
MSRKQKRLALISGAVGFVSLAVLLVLFAFSQAVAYFYVPGDLAKAKLAPGTRIRLGGLVATGSVQRAAGTQVHFTVTDTIGAVPVTYDGILPDLFREGQGVVAEGRLTADGGFAADTVLAKHDETYMPKDVADRLKAQGVTLGGQETIR